MSSATSGSATGESHSLQAFVMLYFACALRASGNNSYNLS